ncbi:MAG: hypothetical protein RMJ66_06455, partial [Bacteroidia bacterium]|nr:hypothetical protein [Bacteroidia bacterium]MDW8134693.1 hypothetical protein [Bacteroidia bacterium]
PLLPYGRESRFWMILFPFLIPLSTAWRLARFNATPTGRPSRFFKGLPTPAQAAFWAIWLLTRPTGIWLHPFLWISQILLVCTAMVSSWPFFSLKSKQNIGLALVFLCLSAGVSLAAFFTSHAQGIALMLLLLYGLSSRVASSLYTA